MRKFIPLLLCVTLALSGCASKSGGSDSARTTAEGTATGTVIGALLGGVVAIATGNARWVAYGAGAGAVVGTGVGLYVAKKKEEYATREEWLNDSIDKAQKASVETANYNLQLKAELAKLDAQSAQLAAAYKSQSAKASEMKKMQADLAKKQMDTNTYISNVEQVIASHKSTVVEARAENRTREADIIEHEIAKMELQVKELREESNKLADMSMRVSI